MVRHTLKVVWWLLIATLILVLDTLATMILMGAFIGTAYYGLVLLLNWRGE